MCHIAKQVRLPFVLRESKSTSIFGIIQSNAWGLYRHSTHGNCTGFPRKVDNLSKCTRVFFFPKTLVPQLIKEFVAYVSTQFNRTTKIIRSNNGTEFVNRDLQNFCTQLGILQQ